MLTEFNTKGKSNYNMAIREQSRIETPCRIVTELHAELQFNHKETKQSRIKTPCQTITELHAKLHHDH